MIAYLTGKPIGATEETLVLDVSGVGYELIGTPHFINQSMGVKSLSAWVYTSVKEDAIQLYGFSSEAEKTVFLQLLKVDRVGPKMAIKVLSGSSHEKIVRAIDSGDVSELSKLPKVGKKMAEQIIFKLKGKLPNLDFAGEGGVIHSERRQILSALVNLGYKSMDVEKVIETMPNDITVEEGVRSGLAALSGHSN